MFLHFTVHLVSSSWIASHPTCNYQTSAAHRRDLLSTSLAFSLSVCYFPTCRLMAQTGMTFVCKTRDRAVKCSTPAFCFWLQVAVSGRLLELQFGFLNCAVGSRSSTHHHAVFLGIRTRIGLGQREKQRWSGIKYSQR